MKIVQVLNHFLPNQTAGTEIYTWALSKNLISLGNDVKVVIPNYNSQESFDYVYDGISVHQYSEPSIVDKNLIMGFKAPSGLDYFKKYLLEYNPDVVNFHELAGSNGIGLNHVRVAKSLGFKVIMTFHLANNTCRTGTMMFKGKELCQGQISLEKCSNCYLHNRGLGLGSNVVTTLSKVYFDFKINPSRWGNKIGTLFGTVNQIYQIKNNFHELVNLCDQVVTITKWYTAVLERNNIESKKITLISQGLPTSNIESLKIIKQENRLRLMFLGRISHFKGLHLLISAIESFPENEVELSIFGGPTESNYEMDLRERTKCKSNIFWKGILPQDQVVQQMRNHDVLCLCSTFSEMSPLVIQEAKAAEIPVLASNVYGNSEQIQNDVDGLLFKFNSIDSLRKQIKRLIENRSLLSQLKRNIGKPRSFVEIGREYQKLYKQVLS